MFTIVFTTIFYETDVKSAKRKWTGIVCFCTINGSFRILKKAGENVSDFLRNFSNENELSSSSVPPTKHKAPCSLCSLPLKSNQTAVYSITAEIMFCVWLGVGSFTFKNNHFVSSTVLHTETLERWLNPALCVFQNHFRISL